MEQQKICRDQPIFVAVHISLASFMPPSPVQGQIHVPSEQCFPVRAVVQVWAVGECLPPLSHLIWLLLPLSAISQCTVLGEHCFGSPQLFPPGLSNVELAAGTGTGIIGMEFEQEFDCRAGR